MSILASLEQAYRRRREARGDVPPFGYSRVEVGYCVVLREDGSPIGEPASFLHSDGKKTVGQKKELPSPLNQRTSGVRPNFLWDKTVYALGVTADAGKNSIKEHSAFVRFHQSILSASDDIGLLALRRFVENWDPSDFKRLGWPDEMKDTNIVFGLQGEYRDQLIHEREAAREIWSSLMVSEQATEAVCLVLGKVARIARSHPPIKGVKKAQSSGAFIISFNDDAYTSYGHEQGDNAPVSEAAAFAYTTALNRFLELDSGHRIQIGDASTVFWADAAEADRARQAENLFAEWFEGPPPDSRIDVDAQAKLVGSRLAQIKAGETLSKIPPDLAEGVRFHVLGLAPNAARLSIRFYYENDFGVLAENYRRYVEDMRIEPRPAFAKPISISRMVARTAPARGDSKGKLSFDMDRISPLLSGELLRAILTGDNFPSSLLPLLLTRVRADHYLDSVRVGLLKGLIVRRLRKAGKLPVRADGTIQEDYLVRSDPNDPNPARRLGRLFALIERAQLASLGDDVNVTVKDKYLGAAASTPAQVFVSIHDNAQHHLKRLRNGHSDAKWIKDAQQARRVSAGLQRDIGRIWATFNDGLPAQHSTDEQALFLVGYYQERFGGKAEAETGDPDDALEINDQGEE